MGFLPKLAKGILKSKNFKSVKTDLDRVKSDFEQLKSAKDDMKINLNKSCQNFLDNMKDLRKTINAIFDDLEMKAIEEKDRLYDIHDKDITTDTNTCDNLIAELEQSKKHLESSGASESLLFIRMKNSQKKIFECRNVIGQISQSKGDNMLEFTIDPSLLKFVENISTLGTFNMSQDISSHDIRKSLIKQTHQTSEVCQTQQIQSLKYNVCKKKEFNVKVKKDKDTCSIQGICQLPTGDLLASDSSNNSLKQVDSTTYTIVDHCTLPASPHGVCCTGPQEAAVALSFNNTIQFVSVGRKMKTTRSIQLDHGCYGLVHHSGKLYVTELCGTKLYVYSTSGQLLQCVHTDTSGKQIFSSTKHVCVSGDGTRLYVADYNKGLVTLDSNGRWLSALSHPDLDAAHGVCTDTQGNVFVCGWDSNNVVQFGDMGTRALGVVVPKSDGVYRPNTLWFDSKQSRLIVSSNPLGGGSDTLQAYTLQ